MVTIPYWFIRYGLPAGFLLLATISILFARHGLHGGDSAAAEASRAKTVPARVVPKRQSARRPTAATHSVESGDTLGTIAERFETTVSELLALNPGIDPRALRVGEELRVSR
jgi:LysM repeat protein